MSSLCFPSSQVSTSLVSMVMSMGQHLMGSREIEQRLGVSRQRVNQLASRADWPRPYDELAMGKVWRKEDVEAWIREHRPELPSDE